MNALQLALDSLRDTGRQLADYIARHPEHADELEPELADINAEIAAVEEQLKEIASR